MINNKITMERVKHHFTYNLWKYVLLVVVSIFAWDIVFSMTAYRAPADKRVHVYILQPGADATAMEENLTAPMMERIEGLLEVTFTTIDLSQSSDYTVDMQLTTYMGAGQGDLFMTPRFRFGMYAGGEFGVFMPLDDFVDSGVIDIAGIDTSEAMATDEAGERHLYGIPMDGLYGLLAYGIDPSQMFMSIPSYSGNPTGAAQAIDYLMKTFSGEKPDWYDEYKTQQIEGSAPQSLIYDRP